jgi:hypothetical protein
LNWSSLLVGLALLIAVAALLRARAAVRRIERLSESYWELRYENGQVKARVTRLEVEAGLREPAADPELPRQAATSFVPLSSLKK